MSTLGSGRYLSLLSVRPVAPLSFPPPSRAGCETSPPALGCAFPLRAGEGSGTTSQEGAGAAAGPGPRGAGPGGVWGREAARSLRAARRQLSRPRTPREGAGGGGPLPGKAEV